MIKHINIKPLHEYVKPCDHFTSGTMGVYSQTYTQYIITNSGMIFVVGDGYKDQEYKYLDAQNHENITGMDITTSHPERGTLSGIIVVEHTNNGFDSSLEPYSEMTIYHDNDHTDYKA